MGKWVGSGSRRPPRRWSLLPAWATAMAMVGLTLILPPASLAASGAQGLRFADVTGLSGELDAVWLNPAAAASLARPLVEVGVAGLAAGDAAKSPFRYSVAAMDAGVWKGGFVFLVNPAAGGGYAWSGSYTVAKAWGRGALGSRFNYQRADLAGGGVRNLWYLDFGATARLAPQVGLGAAVYRIKLHESWPGLAAPGGRLGLTLAIPDPNGLLLSGAVVVDDLRAHDTGSLEAGLVAPLGRRVRLLGAYSWMWPSGADRGRWIVGATVDWRQARLAFSYDAAAVYRVGLRLAF